MKKRLKSALALFAILIGTTDAAFAEAHSADLKGHRLQQVALTTSDLPRAIRFYRDTLGLPLMFETNGMAFFDVAGMRLMIAQDKLRPINKRPTSILYFDAPEFEVSLLNLKATGVPFEGSVETVQRTAQGDLKLQQFKDPDGNALAIMGMVPKR
jgi:catechol 2,3-dioxygenase-like lactoylglutathione lyase family enzyme